MEYTIEITQYCENSCPYCSSDASISGNHLSLDKVLNFFEENNISEKDRINISGGEPLAHPNFYQILQECYKRTQNVWVYTNAIHQIKYNPHVLTKGIHIEANLCLYDGCFENDFTIPKGTKVNFLKFIPTGRGKNIKSLDFHISSNISDNCSDCKHHALLQADGKIVKTPCRKNYNKI